MKEFLKGTYKMNKSRRTKEKKSGKDISEEFEVKAIEKLGGSIAFVSKSKMLWNG